MRRLAFIATVATAVVVAGAGQGAATWLATLVVDDDAVQCASAAFTSIQAAADAAQPGDLIRVCPGVYAETVAVDKPPTLKGDPDAVEAIDCFEPTLGELSVDQHAIADPAGDGFTIALSTTANDVAVEGFVIQGATLGIDAADGFSGYRIATTQSGLNSLFGLDFGSAGARESRVDHNCIRENRYGLVSELDSDFGWRNTNLDDAERARRMTIPRDLLNARIDHNITFRNTVGLDLAGPGIHNAATMDHNESRGQLRDRPERRRQCRHRERDQTGGGGIAVGGANRRLEIVDNRVDAGRQGLGFTRVNFFIDWFGDASTEVVIANNVFTGLICKRSSSARTA